MRMLNIKSIRDNPFCWKTGRTGIQPRYHLSYSNRIYVRLRFLDEDVKYKKHKEQSVFVGKRGRTWIQSRYHLAHSNCIHVRPRFLDNDVKCKKHKEQVVSLENGGVHGYNQDITCHIQIVSMYALVFGTRMLNIKSIKKKGAYMNTPKISVIIFKSYLCSPPVFFG